jgi:hypothetical protein
LHFALLNFVQKEIGAFVKHLIDIVKVLFFVVGEPVGLKVLLFSSNKSLVGEAFSPIGVYFDHGFDVGNVGVLVHELGEYLRHRSSFLWGVLHCYFSEQYK